MKIQMSPKVSINLCCYNSEKYLREALDSIVNQTYKDWELVIINDGSLDSTESIINEYINRGHLIIYHCQQNKGLGYSRNEALKRSQGEFIAFMDHDDLWMPDKLEKQIPLFYKDTKIGIVACNAILFNNEHDEALFCKRKPTTGYVFREMLGNYCICFPSAVIRRSALDGLDEWFDARFNHVLDSDLFMRILYTWHFDYVDERLAQNRIHKGSSSYLRPDLPPKEKEMMISKFIGLYPDFEKLYYKEVLKSRYYSQYYFALIDWRQGQNYLVRVRLRPFLSKQFRAIIPFLLSFFPYVFYKALYTLFNKHIRKIPLP
jgi:glycosyltransferase involved in cell wall biosynthesis